VWRGKMSDEIKFIIHSEKLRNPLATTKLIAEFIKETCGVCYIEAPKGFFKPKN